MDWKHSQTSQDEWKPKGWGNSAGFPARCSKFSVISSFRPLNIVHRSQVNLMMIPLPLQSIGHMFITKDSWRSSTL
jgi:hypothetical protein